jgi:hypothetical protein
MDHYYVNNRAQENRDHEVHKEGCIYLPVITDKLYLGMHINCQEAVKEALKFYKRSNGCKTCCPECHTS